MKQGWESKKLGSLCTIKTGRKDVNSGNPDGMYPFFTCARSHTYSDEYSFDTEALLIAGNGDVGSVSYFKGKFEAYQRTYVLSDFTDVSTRYLFMYLNGFLKDTVSKQKLGNTMPYIKLGMLKEFPVPIASPSEQKRIVAVLDRCFEAIEKAKANVERNLQNAKDLFQSQLNQIFTQKGEGWVEKKLGECIKLKSGDGLTAKNMILDGCYPVYGGNGIAGQHNVFNTEGSQVIIGRVGALCGNARHINEKIWLTDNAFRVSECFYQFDNSFLTYLLNYKNLRSYARQASQPVISNSSTKDVLLQFPKDVGVQSSIVHQLDELRNQTQALESKYQQELDALDELKKSILQKAFNGELTETEEAA